MTKICERCKVSFDCSVKGSQDAISKCWCMDYPALPRADIKSDSAFEVDSDNKVDCMCPNCLTAVAQNYIQTHVDNVDVHHFIPEIAKQSKDLPLIEGLDYSIENGRWVLSRWYLLKKGECCGNACRNCPYGHRNVK